MKSTLLVIPAYNESNRLPQFIGDLAREINLSKLKIHVLIVDDGSARSEQDFLKTKISEIQPLFPFILDPLILKQNLGKGGAILQGWDSGNNYDNLAFVDADGAVPATEVTRLLKLSELEYSNHIIFASRVKLLGRSVTRTFSRHLSGRIFSFFVGSLIDSRVYDSQCGFKIIPIKYYQKTKNKIKGRRFSFDVELVAIAKYYNIETIEIPINCSDVSGSKVKLFRDSARMFFSVIQIKKEIKKWTSSKTNN